MSEDNNPPGLEQRIADAIGQVRITDDSVDGCPSVPLLSLADFEERKAIARACMAALTQEGVQTRPDVGEVEERACRSEEALQAINCELWAVSGSRNKEALATALKRIENTVKVALSTPAPSEGVRP